MSPKRSPAEGRPPVPLLLVGAALAAACAGSGTGAGPAPAEPEARTGAAVASGSASPGTDSCADLPERPFRAALDPLEDSRRGTRIRFYNTTGCTLRVTAISLFDCDNVQNECDRELPLDVVVPPGAERNVLAVLSESRNYAWSFQYRYRWARVRE